MKNISSCLPAWFLLCYLLAVKFQLPAVAPIALVQHSTMPAALLLSPSLYAVILMLYSSSVYYYYCGHSDVFSGSLVLYMGMFRILPSNLT